MCTTLAELLCGSILNTRAGNRPFDSRKPKQLTEIHSNPNTVRVQCTHIHFLSSPKDIYLAGEYTFKVPACLLRLNPISTLCACIFRHNGTLIQSTQWLLKPFPRCCPLGMWCREEMVRISCVGRANVMLPRSVPPRSAVPVRHMSRSRLCA